MLFRGLFTWAGIAVDSHILDLVDYAVASINKHGKNLCGIKHAHRAAKSGFLPHEY
jgi:hypothetical protein